MDNTKAQLIDMVSSAMRGKKVEQDMLNNIDWKNLLKLADSHHIKGLIYYSLSNTDKVINMDNEVLQKWKKDTLLTAVHQLQHIRQVSDVLNKLNECKISVIVLKGLVIRELYSRPELRTMCDADILVKPWDLDKVKKIMEEIGYTEEESSLIHLSYINSKSHTRIEIHWTIEDKRFFKAKHDMESEMWSCAEKVKVGESEVLSFSPEDLALHLCIHMAVHILTSGFGIRQICDLVLLVEKKGESINWFSFYQKGKRWGIERFIVIIFLTCKQLFGLAMPKEIEKHTALVDSKIVKLLIDDILSGGVYGRKDLPYVFANEFAYDLEEQQGGSSRGVIKRFLRLLFPPIMRLSNRYEYAKKYRILLPIAWLHHLYSGVTHTQYGLVEKIRFFRLAIFISNKRNKLLKKLGL